MSLASIGCSIGQIPRLRRQTNVVALLKPGKDPSEVKSFQHNSQIGLKYMLLERLILNRLAAHVDGKFIQEQA